jgi:hypothetical protein
VEEVVVNDYGGGGGAGGYRQNYPSPITAGLPVTATAYPITVGVEEEAASPARPGTKGSDSIFSTITSTGGGFGGTGLFHQVFRGGYQEVQVEEVEEVELIKHQDQVEQEIPLQ